MAANNIVFLRVEKNTVGTSVVSLSVNSFPHHHRFNYYEPTYTILTQSRQGIFFNDRSTDGHDIFHIV